MAIESLLERTHRTPEEIRAIDKTSSCVMKAAAVTELLRDHMCDEKDRLDDDTLIGALWCVSDLLADAHDALHMKGEQ